MPSLVLFGERSVVGGDDLQPISLAAILVRGLQTILLLPPVLLLIFDAKECSLGLRRIVREVEEIDEEDEDEDSIGSGSLFPSIMISYVCFCALVIFSSLYIELQILKVSSIGSPTQSNLRQLPLAKYVETKILWLPIFQSIVFVLGVLSLHSARISEKCDDANVTRQFWFIDVCILLSSQAAELVVSFLGSFTCLLHRCTLSRRRRAGGSDAVAHTHGSVEDAWEDRCRCICACLARSTCFLFGGSEVDVGEYDQIARVLADYFEGFDGARVDLVASDIVVGIAMLQKLQKQRRFETLARLQHNDVSEHSFDSKGTRQPNLPTNPSTALLSPTELTQQTSPSDCKFSHSNLRFRSKSLSDSQNDISALEYEERLNCDYHLHNFAEDTLHLSFRRSSSGGNIYYKATERRLLSADDAVEFALLNEGSRMSRHALAIYSWMLYIYMHPCSGAFKLLCFRLTNMKGSTCPNSDNSGKPGNIIGDNICGIHKTALLKHAGLNQSDLIYANFESSLEQSPYCIVVDHEWKSVVVSIRGTLSLEDCVTDVLVDPIQLDDFIDRWGFDESYIDDGRNGFIHSGVLMRVEWILSDLHRHKLLEKLIRDDYPEYSLRFCGHSLGAGIAVLLSLVYRKDFPNLKCFAFSPPGGLMTKDLAVRCSEFVCSFVLDCDLVPRLSVQSMSILRDEVLDLIARIKVPKFVIAESIVKDILGKDSNLNLNDYVHLNGPLPDSDLARQLERLKSVQERRRQDFRGPIIKLYPPGKIIHLVKVDEIKSCAHDFARCLTCWTSNVGYDYVPVWESNEALGEIEISPTMYTDHFPNRVCLELEKVANQFRDKSIMGFAAYPSPEFDIDAHV